MTLKNRAGRAIVSQFQVYLDEINNTPLLSTHEERELAARIAEGDAHARDRMIRANLRLVVRLAKGFRGRGVSLDDLISEGNLGLIRAVEGFDPEKNVRFGTYASYWIKQSMRSGTINLGKPVRVPMYTVSLRAKWRRASAILADRLKRSPTPDEVGKAMGLSERKRQIVTQALLVSELTPEPGDAGETNLARPADRRARQPGQRPAGRGRRPGPAPPRARAADATRGPDHPDAVRP